MFVLPAVLLSVGFLQDVIAYKVRHYVHDVYARVAILVFAYGVAFVVGAEWVSPWIERAFVMARREGKRQWGSLGLALFYGLAYGALYWAYLIEERGGPGALLPSTWR